MIREPKIFDIKKIEYSKPYVSELASGIPAYFINGGDSNVIQIDFVFEAGSLSANKNFLALYANKIFRDAPESMDADTFSEILDYYGCITKGFVSHRFAGIKAFIQKRFLKEVLPLISELIVSPSIIDSEFETFRANYHQKLKTSLTKTNYLALKALNNSLFGNNHPLGYPTKLEDALDININDVKKFIEDNYKNRLQKIVCAGDLDLNQRNEIINIIDSSQTLSFHKKDSVNNNKLEESQKRDRFIEKKDALQSSVFLGKHISTKAPDDVFLLTVLNTVFGGYFGSRLMKNIREDKGFTYGIGSLVTLFPNDTKIMRIITDVGIEYTEQTLKEIEYEMNRLAEKTVSDKELRNVKNYMMGELMGTLDGPFLKANSFLKLLENNTNFDFIDRQVDAISNATPDNIKKQAQNHLNFEHFHKIIVGKM